MRCGRYFSLVLALTALGCGGAEGDRPDSYVLPTAVDDGPSYLNCSELSADTIVDTIEDFELGAANFYVSDDDSPSAQQLVAEKPVSGSPLATQAIPGGRCGSKFAFHVSGQNFVIWGSGFGVSGGPFDYSQYDGVLFWARRGPTGQSTLSLTANDAHTANAGVVQVPPEQWGKDVCNPCLKDCPDSMRGVDPAPPEDPICDLCSSSCEGATKAEYRGGVCLPGEKDYEEQSLEVRRQYCGESFNYTVSLTNEWRLFKVPFAELRQAGWRFQAPFFDPSAIYSFGFYQPVGDVDTWVDDLGLYKEP